MASVLEELEKAGLLKGGKLSDQQKKEIEKLTPQEVETLKSIRSKLASVPAPPGDGGLIF